MRAGRNCNQKGFTKREVGPDDAERDGGSRGRRKGGFAEATSVAPRRQGKALRDIQLGSGIGGRKEWENVRNP